MCQGFELFWRRDITSSLNCFNNFSRSHKQTQFASITVRSSLKRLPLRPFRKSTAKRNNTQLNGEIRKAKLIKHENDIPCVTYRSCELWGDIEPFEKFRVGLPDCGGIYIPERELHSVPGKISDRGYAFRVPLLHSDDLDVVGHIARHYC